MRKLMACLSIAGSMTLAAADHAVAVERTIASPALVEAAGFAPGTTVYVAVPGTGEPTPYFGSQPAMTSLAGNYFRGRVSTYAYNSPGGRGDVSWASGDIFADAHLDLPTGVVIDAVRWWANDTFAGDLLFFVIQSCLPAGGAGSPDFTVLGQSQTTGTTGNQSGVITVTGGVVDNNTCHYWVRANFGGSVGMTLQKACVEWRRQVSPAPAVATFPNDVPTSHPFFRFVEAMAASGLTGGCAAGSFCPDSPVTRGQLSVFLAVALGLHFPN